MKKPKSYSLSLRRKGRVSDLISLSNNPTPLDPNLYRPGAVITFHKEFGISWAQPYQSQDSGRTLDLCILQIPGPGTDYKVIRLGIHSFVVLLRLTRLTLRSPGSEIRSMGTSNT